MAMEITLRVLARVAGSVVGLLAGGALVFWTTVAVVAWVVKPPEDSGFFLLIVCGTAGSIVGATVGAAAGAAVLDRGLRDRSAFGKALLGAVAGLLAGCVLPLCLFCAWLLGVNSPTQCWAAAIGFSALPSTTGAVVGSGWKAKPNAEAQS